jgi:hypothetical protein
MVIIAEMTARLDYQRGQFVPPGSSTCDKISGVFVRVSEIRPYMLTFSRVLFLGGRSFLFEFSLVFE